MVASELTEWSQLHHVQLRGLPFCGCSSICRFACVVVQRVPNDGAASFAQTRQHTRPGGRRFGICIYSGIAPTHCSHVMQGLQGFADIAFAKVNRHNGFADEHMHVVSVLIHKHSDFQRNQ